MGGKHFEGRLCGTCHAGTEGREFPGEVIRATPEQIDEVIATMKAGISSAPVFVAGPCPCSECVRLRHRIEVSPFKP